MWTVLQVLFMWTLLWTVLRYSSKRKPSNGSVSSSSPCWVISNLPWSSQIANINFYTIQSPLMLLLTEFLVLDHLCSTHQHSCLLLPQYRPWLFSIISTAAIAVSTVFIIYCRGFCCSYHLYWVNCNHIPLVFRHICWFLLPNSKGRIICLWQSVRLFLVFTLMSLRNLSKPQLLLLLSLRVS